MTRINPISPVIRSQPRKRNRAEQEHWASAYGTDDEFRAWVRKRPSCLDLAIPCVSAHVRRAHNSGAATKPVFSCVALTDDQHKEQSWHGEAACLNRFRPKPGGWTNLQAKEFFDQMADLHLKAWAESKGWKPY